MGAAAARHVSRGLKQDEQVATVPRDSEVTVQREEA
jgi:hypothetical protein